MLLFVSSADGLFTWGRELLSNCAEAALVVTVLLAAREAAGTRAAARMGAALVTRRARENIFGLSEQQRKVSGGGWVFEEREREKKKMENGGEKGKEFYSKKETKVPQLGSEEGNGDWGTSEKLLPATGFLVLR